MHRLGRHPIVAADAALGRIGTCGIPTSSAAGAQGFAILRRSHDTPRSVGVGYTCPHCEVDPDHAPIVITACPI